MFAAKNPFEDIVVKATSDELTSENWELNLEICDRVSSEGETSARNCINAIQKRLIHRNANVQLYALTLSDTLSKNCGLPVHQELASRSFTQTLSRISLDRNTHPTVKKRTLALIRQWATDFEDESLGIMKETYDSLRQQDANFEDEPEPEREEPSSEQLRAEDEELRRVLELSVQDQGGRNNWTPSYSNGGAAQSSSSSSAAPAVSSSGPVQSSAPASAAYSPALAQGSSGAAAVPASTAPAAAPVLQAEEASAVVAPAASRVRALYDFSPTEPGELAFSKGDVIRVLDSVYEHWWRGEVRGEAGIFPVNYVEVLPDPTPAEMQREAEMEARIFSQAADIDRLLSKLRGLDPARDNLAEDDELQELYQSSLAMRPKIVRLIDRYSTKITELKAMNDKFVRARGTFDEMMEQSLARYNPAGQATQDYLRPRPEYVQQAAGTSVPVQGPAEYGQVAAPHVGGYAQQAYVGGSSGVGGAPHPQAYVAAPQQSEADYAQWYHAQQQQQQQQHQQHQQAQHQQVQHQQVQQQY